tara:strand:+ start:16362 stop:17039 length:678 start_codon:yes stop_codon:yes gene_type:complete
MNKIIVLLILIPILNFSQSAENKKKEINKWDIGLNGGVNINNPISDSSNINELRSQGTLYGLTVVYHFNRFFAFKADFDIENRGWEMNTLGQELNNGIPIPKFTDVKQTLDYFDIPAFMHIGFGKRFKVDLNVGPYFGFKIKDEITSSNEIDEAVIRGELGIGEFKNFDYGLVYGVGFDYEINRLFSFGFDALLEKGMRVINNGSYKNSSIDFDFGINIHLGRKK